MTCQWGFPCTNRTGRCPVHDWLDTPKPDEITPEMRAYWRNRLGPEKEQQIYDDVARLLPDQLKGQVTE